MNYVAEIIKKRNLSKYRIAKILSTSWNTVQMWYREIYEPIEENKKKLKQILNGDESSDELLLKECKKEKEITTK